MSDWKNTVNVAWVREIARVACLRMTEEEIAEQTAELRQMLAALDALGDFDTREAWKENAVGMDALREDSAKPFSERDAMLSAAPVREGDFFRVPSALEREEERNG